MSQPTHELTIESDPWQSQDGAPLMRCDRSLLEAVIDGNVLNAQKALLQGADPLTEVSRTKGKEVRSIAGLSTWHEEDVAKVFLDLFCSIDYLDRKRFVLSIMSSSGMPIPQNLIAWFLEKEASRLTRLDHENYWRFLAARKCWDVMVRCRPILWGGDKPHMGSTAYTAIFAWVRAVLSSDPAANVVKQWMTQALLAYESAEERLLVELVDEFAMQHSVQGARLSQQVSLETIAHDFSRLLVRDASIRKTLDAVHDGHASKPIFRQAIKMADADRAQSQANALLDNTIQVEHCLPRERL